MEAVLQRRLQGSQQKRTSDKQHSLAPPSPEQPASRMFLGSLILYSAAKRRMATSVELRSRTCMFGQVGDRPGECNPRTAPADHAAPVLGHRQAGHQAPSGSRSDGHGLWLTWAAGPVSSASFLAHGSSAMTSVAGSASSAASQLRLPSL